MEKDRTGNRFFENRACAYYPCHKGLEEGSFNCLFCFCPLYVLGRQCGGNFVYLENGVKSCENCTFPHRPENYDRILARYPEIMDAVRKMDEKK